MLSTYIETPESEPFILLFDLAYHLWGIPLTVLFVCTYVENNLFLLNRQAAILYAVIPDIVIWIEL